MATCNNCGAPLREGAGFCSACGVTVNTSVFCRQCGTELDAGDKFCYACGAPVKAAAASKAAPAAGEQPRRRGRPPKNAAPAAGGSLKDTYPNVLGFYGYSQRNRVISVSDRAVVLSGYNGLYRVDKALHMLYLNQSVTHAVQTKTGVLALTKKSAYDSEQTLDLLELDDSLKLLSRRQLLTLPGYGMPEKCLYTMSEHYLFTVRYLPVENENGEEIHQGLTFTRLCLDSGEEITLSADSVTVEGCPLSGCGDALLADSGTLYFIGDVQEQDENGNINLVSISMAVDFDAGEFRPLWKAEGRGDYYGQPQYFDFAKGIMWTYPREMEMKRRGWDKRPDKYLVPRKIGWGTPILANYNVWTLNDQTDLCRKFAYFDGTHAYYAPDYYHFYMVDANGLISEDWNGTGHGRPETAVVWPQAGKVIADLLADYYYSTY